MKYPLISIITSSFNQGHFIERTIQSVLQQNYPQFEHIIVDGMSTDHTPEILARYPHLKIIREPDHGQADAINKGFAIATGSIISFLNSDDTLVPNTFYTVAKTINPALNRHIVMGRCRFIDENDQFTGIEHPSFYLNHRRLLAFWKSHTIPQPALFWSKAVLAQCGSLNEQEQLVLDYDLFCRFSKHYSFYYVDEIFANYRLHQHSKTCLNDDSTRFAETLRVSKQYWGPILSLNHLYLRFSLLCYLRDQYSRQQLKKGKNFLIKRQFLKAWSHLIIGAFLGPDIIYFSYFQQKLLKKFQLRIRNFVKHTNRIKKYYPQSKAYLNYNTVWPDQWIGPIVEFSIQQPQQQMIYIKGETLIAKQTFEISIYKNQKMIKTFTQYNFDRYFEWKINLPEFGNLENCIIRITTGSWTVMHHHIKNHDFRPLAWKLRAIAS